MPDLPRIAGIVLAGGKSSRMGQNKAFLEFGGRHLVQHMMDILRDLGLKDVFISGSLDGYPCLPDDSPFSGPAQAIKSVLRQKPNYEGYLFIPIDMPFLSKEILRLLLEQKNGGYFIERPLPAYLAPPFVPCRSISVQNLLEAQSISPVTLPPEFQDNMKNINTPQEWREAKRAL